MVIDFWLGMVMLEKRFPAVPPQSFTVNPTANGVVTIADTTLFKVKQLVMVAANTLPTLDKLEVKQVLSPTQMIIGPAGGAIHTTTDLSAYTTLLSGAVFYPSEQKRPVITADDFERAVYEEEPIVAKRVIGVDQMGRPYNQSNPFPVNIAVSQDDMWDDIQLTYNVIQDIDTATFVKGSTSTTFQCEYDEFGNLTRFYKV